MNKNQKILDVLNSLGVIEMKGGEDTYILVENNQKNQKALNDVGVSTETINKYGDEETFCILALASGEWYATDFKGGKLIYESSLKERITDRLKEEVEFAKGTGMPQFVMGMQQAIKVIEDMEDEE